MYVSVKEPLGKSPYGLVLINIKHTRQLQLSVAVKLVIRYGVPGGVGLVWERHWRVLGIF